MSTLSPSCLNKLKSLTLFFDNFNPEDTRRRFNVYKTSTRGRRKRECYFLQSAIINKYALNGEKQFR